MTSNRLPVDVRSEVRGALDSGAPVVAFETTILSFGLPRPLNREVGFGCEARVRAAGCVPATVAVLDGRIVVGLTADEIEFFCAGSTDIRKVNTQNLAAVLASGAPGALTVGASLLACAAAGIRVFCTGGIGGVHRDWQAVPDVSSDLFALSRFPVLTVSAGTKSILDVESTLEVLETLGVPVCGWCTDTFPLFHCVESNFPVTLRVDEAATVARLCALHFELAKGGVLLGVPLPKSAELGRADLEEWIAIALRDAAANGIKGRHVTPYVLKRLEELSAGKTLVANTALIFNNAEVAGHIALALSQQVRGE